MKNNIAFFTHETAAYDNGKFLLLRAYYGGERGWAMEAKFWALNCKIGLSDSCRLDLNRKDKQAEVAKALDLSLKELEEFLRVLSEKEYEIMLLKRESGIVWTEQTQDDLKRAMSVRIEAQNRRKGKIGRQLDDEPQTSADESQTSADENDGAEQSRAEQNSSKNYKSSKHSISSRDDHADDGFGLPAAADLIMIDEIRNAVQKAPFQIRLSQRDLEDISVNLNSHALDTGFIAYVIRRAQERDVKKPGAFARSALLGEGALAAMADEYRAEPPAECDACGIKLGKYSADEYGCKSCGSMWQYDAAFGVWVKSAENLKTVVFKDAAEALRKRASG